MPEPPGQQGAPLTGEHSRNQDEERRFRRVPPSSATCWATERCSIATWKQAPPPHCRWQEVT